MGKTVLEMTDEERAEWRRAFRTFVAEESTRHDEECEQRRERALTLARAKARELKVEYGADRVVLFGSLATGRFTRWSDVDLMAFGVPEDRRLAAMADAGIEHDDDPTILGVDVLIAEEATPEMLASVLGEGIEL